ncbi:hypothetical protein [Variovorax boronicumulans]|uniref:hypothetical protein n=1 Tax=Variovorax boronicumulans TaxID=436515 RepID=UPI00339B75F5
MTSQFRFPAAQRSSVESLREQMATALQRPVTTEYGSTDCGQHWAALCVEDSRAVPTTLVSIVIGAGVPGEASVLSRDGLPLREGVAFPDALAAARTVCLRSARRSSARARRTR